MILVLLILVFFGLGVDAVGAVFYAENKIYLYENGRRIEDDSVMQDKNFQSPLCKAGICIVGQQYEEITFYKIRDRNMMSSGEWRDNWYLSHKGCEGFAEKKEQLGEALNKWRRAPGFQEIQDLGREGLSDEDRIKMLTVHRIDFFKAQGFDFYDNPVCAQINFDDYEDVYLEGLRDGAVYTTIVRLPPPDPGGGLKGEPGTFGGRIGDDRVLSVDLKTGVVSRTLGGGSSGWLVSTFLKCWNFFKGWILNF